MKQKVMFVTGTRAEYGLLRRLIQVIRSHPRFDVELLVTGSHLSSKHGNTVKEIEDDSIPIDFRVDIELDDDSPNGIAHSTGVALQKISNVLTNARPNLIVVLGDRFEIMAACLAALFHNIPIAHLHGGEITEGAMDDSLRHSISKCSHLHFVACEEYRRRVIQLGESPERVHNVGGLGVDAIHHMKLMHQEELEESLGFRFLDKNFLVTFHPVTLEPESLKSQISELLLALTSWPDARIIFTMPNADTHSHIVAEMIQNFVKNHKNAVVFHSLGQRRYLSSLVYSDVIIGNSSSGIAEVPSFQKPTVNIGSRQQGRLKASSVIDCAPDHLSISKAIRQALAPEFREILDSTKNPYGDGGAVDRIVEIFERTNFRALIKKPFFDIPAPETVR